MISRREVVTAGVLGTLATGGSAAAAELQQEAQALRAGFDSLASTLNDIKTSLDEGLRGIQVWSGRFAQEMESRIRDEMKKRGYTI